MSEKANKLSFSDLGKLGAAALNSNKEKKLAACRKAAATNLAKNPDHYRNMAILRKVKRQQNKEFVNA